YGQLLNYGRTARTLTAGSYVVRGATLELVDRVAANASTLVLDGAGGKLVYTSPTDHDALEGLARNAGAGELTLDGDHTLTTAGPLGNAGIVTLSGSSSLTTTGAYRQ